MTWRNFVYWLMFVLPVMGVAAAADSDHASEGAAPLLSSVWVPSPMDHFSDPLRFVCLLAGAVAVLITFHRMWQNLRGRS
jgi:hypothetical protein